MAIYQGLFGASFRYMRADTLPAAVHAMRQAFGFAPRGYVQLAGDNSTAQSLGDSKAYDEWAQKEEGRGHRVAKAARVRARATHANGKGAALPKGLNILEF